MKKYLRLLGVCLFAWLLLRIDWQIALDTILRLNPQYLMMYAACNIVMGLVRVVRLKLVMKRLGYRPAFSDCYVATIEPVFFGLVTPGRLGEFSRVFFLRQMGLRLPGALSLVVVERLADATVLVMLAVAGASAVLLPPPYDRLWIPIALAGPLAVWAARSVGHGMVTSSARTFRFGLIDRWLATAFLEPRQELMAEFGTVLHRTIGVLAPLALVCQCASLAQVMLLARAFDFDVNDFVVVFAYAAATLVSLLPISMGGLGTREATYITLMGMQGIDAEPALLFSLLDGVVFAFLGVGLLMVPVWVGLMRRKATDEPRPDRTVPFRPEP